MSAKSIMEPIDILDRNLYRAGVLGDLLQSYNPAHDGKTMFGDTVQLSGSMIFEMMCECQSALNELMDTKEEVRP